MASIFKIFVIKWNFNTKFTLEVFSLTFAISLSSCSCSRNGFFKRKLKTTRINKDNNWKKQHEHFIKGVVLVAH